MNRMTNDQPDSNLSTLLNFAFAGDDRRVKIRNGDTEVDLCDYICEAASIDHGSCGIASDAIMEGGCMDCGLFECPSGALFFAATQAAELRGRLKMIEDILGDTYDLDHLRDLVTAEQEGRLNVAPLKPGDEIYWVLADDFAPGGYYVTEPDKVTDVGVLGFYQGHNMGDLLPDFLSFTPWEEFGKTVFKTQKEAEVAMEKIKEGGNGEL